MRGLADFAVLDLVVLFVVWALIGSWVVNSVIATSAALNALYRFIIPQGRWLRRENSLMASWNYLARFVRELILATLYE